MKISLAQINPIVGDFEYNLNKILDYTKQASLNKSDLIVFSELVICGYPPKDLLLKKQFIYDCKKYLNLLKEKIKLISPKIAVIIGFPEDNTKEGKPLFNSLALIQNGIIIATRQKTLLPTYDVFDEDRYFEPAKENKAVDFNGHLLGLTICEDILHETSKLAKRRYHFSPVESLVKEKINLLINISSSPYFVGKPAIRENIFKSFAKKYKVPVVYVNQTGGNDHLIFDGSSCVINKDGDACLRLKGFEEDLGIVEINSGDVSCRDAPPGRPPDANEELFGAIICGLRDYVKKCGFKKVIIGLSGGIDSALVAVLASYALGSKNVLCVSMPSRYTSKTSIDDASRLALNLDVELKTISIEEPFKAFLDLLGPLWKDTNSQLAEENIQSRIRGLILMALSNQSGALVLSTGNKSELATGYCTLYGDMCGGLAVISDLPKTIVYKLANYVNKKEKKELIPKNILTKAPSAELKPNQTDEDVLPPYETLDKILNAYVEDHLPLSEIIKIGVTKDIVAKVCNMIDLSEYKREQAAPGLKLTSRSFGYGWRMPIAQRYKETI